MMSLSVEHTSLDVLFLLFARKRINLDGRLAGYWLSWWTGKLHLQSVFVFEISK